MLSGWLAFARGALEELRLAFDSVQLDHVKARKERASSQFHFMKSSTICARKRLLCASCIFGTRVKSEKGRCRTKAQTNRRKERTECIVARHWTNHGGLLLG